MKKIDVEICVCTECVMSGALDIEEAIDRVREMAANMYEIYDLDAEIEIRHVKCLGEVKHDGHAPKVAINGKVFRGTDSQTITSEILSLLKKEVNV